MREGHLSADAGSIRERSRSATPGELEAIPWLTALVTGERKRAEAAIVVAKAEPGERVCRYGRAPTFWFGVVEGLLKMSKDGADGATVTYSGISPGGWFGEGTAIKREPYRYDVQALRTSLVAGLPIDSFHWLLDHSIGFNRFVINQLNERLSQFIGALEIDRLNDPDARVARNLAALVNPVLFPKVGDLLRITQQELAYLVGLSRQAGERSAGDAAGRRARAHRVWWPARARSAASADYRICEEKGL